MTLKTSILFSATLATLAMGLLQPVFAADVDQPFADTGHNWEGFYAGVGFGAGGAGVDFAGIGSKGKTEIDDKGATVAGIAGYNYMAGDWLLGVEGSFGTVGLNKSVAVAGLGNVRAKSDWLGTMQLRGGYTFDNVLLYGTAGLAITDLELSSSLGGKYNKTKTGLVVGVGGEFALSDNWTARAEALAYSFQDEATLNGAKRKFDFGEGVVRVGFTRKF
jgi:outer membrane immunogenic protein